MAFIVKKKIHGKEYYYLNQTQRVNGKVKSKCLAYLGKEKNQAEIKAKEILKQMEGKGKSDKNKDIRNQENIKIKDSFVNYLKEKGFVYPSAEIYGGLAGVWDFGHLGKLLKNNLEDTWKKYFLNLGDDFYEIEGSNFMPEDVFKASGHLDNFDDPLAECFECGNAERADKIIEEKLNRREEGASDKELLEIINENKLKCSKCGKDFSKVSRFNMMFPINFGPKKGNIVYLRPETAQTPYLNFKIQYNLLRKKIPFGLAVIGRAFRNEISPKHSILRCREFEQAELQIFFNPSKINDEKISDIANFSDIKNEILYIVLKEKRDKPVKEFKASELIKKGLPKYYVYHMVMVQKYILDILKISKENFRFYELNDNEKAFYNKNHFDVEFYSEDVKDWIEIGGVHYRTDHDLGGHMKVSNTNLEVVDEDTKERYIPHVLELSFGHWRNFYSIIEQHLYYDKERENNVFKIPSKLAPYQIAVCPLMNKQELIDVAKQIKSNLIHEDYNIFYDKSGSIGRRYARNDEIGTPYCITVDYETLEKGESKNTVTIRDRDTTKQIRVKIENLKDVLRKLLNNEIEFEKAGKLI